MFDSKRNHREKKKKKNPQLENIYKASPYYFQIHDLRPFFISLLFPSSPWESLKMEILFNGSFFNGKSQLLIFPFFFLMALPTRRPYYCCFYTSIHIILKDDNSILFLLLNAFSPSLCHSDDINSMTRRQQRMLLWLLFFFFLIFSSLFGCPLFIIALSAGFREL